MKSLIAINAALVGFMTVLHYSQPNFTRFQWGQAKQIHDCKVELTELREKLDMNTDGVFDICYDKVTR